MDIEKLFKEKEQEFNVLMQRHVKLEDSLKDLEVEMFKKQGQLEMLKGMLEAEKAVETKQGFGVIISGSENAV